jgi:predicted transcriptional regulator
MLVLLSIRPSHVENILRGRKTFEFRRRVFARREITRALIYCTKPVGRFVAEFEIEGILRDTPERLWRKTRSGSGISKQFFDDYFAGRDEAFALQIGRVRQFSEHVHPLDIIDDFTPPQSFMYLSASVMTGRQSRRLSA